MQTIHQCILFVTITVVGFLQYTIGANILIAYPATTIFIKSHIRFQAVLSRDLVKRGHRVVVLSNSIIKGLGNSEENYSDMINVKLPYDEEKFMQRSVKFFQLVSDPDASLSDIFTFSYTTMANCVHMWNDTETLKRLKQEHFDLMLVDPFGQCEYLLHCKLGLPFVVFTPAMRYPTFDEDVFRVPAPMSYVPGHMTGFSDHMSVLQRTMNLISRTIVSSIVSYFMVSSFNEIKEDTGLCPEMSFLDLNRKAELWLVNSDVVGDFAHPSTPNVIPIGGLMTEPAKPLPMELEEFVTEPQMDGLIVLSMGSSINMKDHHVCMFMNVLGRVPYQVIFRHVGNLTCRHGDNIKVVKWMPQSDLLGHPRIKLFIGPAGLNGMYEALYNAVPMLLVPHGLDQYDNAVRMREKGVAVILDRLNMDEDDIQKAITDLTSKDRYKEAAQHYSNIHRDQPLSPRERAVYWIEHVLKYGGAHLRPRGADLSFVEYHMLDVALLLFTFVAIFVVISTMCCVKSYRLFRKCVWSKQKQS